MRFTSFCPIALLSAFAFLCGSSSLAATSVTRLRCEHKTAPMGIDITSPRLSWQMTSDQRGQRQSAYRVLVASSEEILRGNRGDLWDSGNISSDQSVDVEYAGAPLTSGMACRWKVIVRDRDGNELVSEPSVWEMGLLQPADWSAKWIDAPEAQSKDKPTGPSSKPVYPPNTPPLFRRTFPVAKPIVRARLYATALGFYECSINGARVGDIVLAPDWTDYRKRAQYQTYDVTPMLHDGFNAIGAILGDGWYCGRVGWLGGHVYGQRPALLAQLVIDYTDGSHDVIGTDETWKTATGPILISDVMQGEDYDAQRQMAGWDTPQFIDTNLRVGSRRIDELSPHPTAYVWQAASLRDEHPALEAQVAPPVRKVMEATAKKVTAADDGKFVVDMGQNMVGYARLKVTAAAGTKITLRFAEMLKPDGAIYTDNLRAARVTDNYICRGTGQMETFEPHFTFHGFRYVEVGGFPGTPPLDAITGVVIASDCPATGTFECSSEVLNKLQSNIVWGQRGNYISVPTDCPQRDERLGWMGDAQVFIRTATFNSDVHAFFENWLADVAEAQSANGAYTDVSPRPGKAAGDGTAAWGDAGIICPWTIYQVHGDTRIIRRQYDSMAKFIDYLKTNSKDLIRPAKGYGDWLSIAADTPKDVLGTAYFAYSSRLMAKMAHAIGKDDDAAKYEQLFQDIRKAFNDKFVQSDGKITGNTQTRYLMALRFELLDEAKQPMAVQHLIDDIKAKGDHLSTGFVGVSYLLPELTKYGHTDLAYRLLNQDTFPSWLFSVKQGATTIWERWDGWTPEKGFQTPKMNSFNHYSLGSCGEWMYETIGGIGRDSQQTGFKHAIIHPQPGGGLTWAKASYDSDYGPIRTDWKINGGKFLLALEVPANTSATVVLPSGDSNGKQILESDKPIAEAEGVKASDAPPKASGTVAVEVSAGRYRFSAPFALQP